MKCFYAAFLSFFYAFLLAAFSQMIFHSAESDIFFCAEKNKNLLRGGKDGWFCGIGEGKMAFSSPSGDGSRAKI